MLGFSATIRTQSPMRIVRPDRSFMKEELNWVLISVEYFFKIPLFYNNFNRCSSASRSLGVRHKCWLESELLRRLNVQEHFSGGL